MKSVLPLLSLTLLFASCTTAYKSGQTPDDVYYSPARPQNEYVRQEKKDDQQYRATDEAYRDDRYLRMKIRNQRYTGLYDDYYSYNPYFYHYYNGYLEYNSPWSSYSYWNYYYNPYCHQVIGYSPRLPVYSHPRTFDLSAYNTQPGTNGVTGRVYHGSTANYNSSNRNTSNNNGNYRNSGSNAGNFLRNAFSGSNNSNSNGSNTNNNSGGRTGSSSSSSSSGSSSSGSTNAPARRF